MFSPKCLGRVDDFCHVPGIEPALLDGHVDPNRDDPHKNKHRE